MYEDELTAPGVSTLAMESGLEASVVAVRRSVVHGQVHHVHVVVMRVDGTVVVVVMVVVVVIVQGGQGLQRGDVGGRGQPGEHHLVVHPALRRGRRVAGAWRHEQGSLYRLQVRRGGRVRVLGVFLGRTHARPLAFCDGLRRRTDPLP